MLRVQLTPRFVLSALLGALRHARFIRESAARSNSSPRICTRNRRPDRWISRRGGQCGCDQWWGLSGPAVCQDSSESLRRCVEATSIVSEHVGSLSRSRTQLSIGHRSIWTCASPQRRAQQRCRRGPGRGVGPKQTKILARSGKPIKTLVALLESLSAVSSKGQLIRLATTSGEARKLASQGRRRLLLRLLKISSDDRRIGGAGAYRCGGCS